VLLWYRIDGSLAVGPPWFRFLVSRAPAGILLKTNRTFPPRHPTTKMTLRLLRQELAGRRCRTLVDVGCGSGILSLAGLKCGVDLAVALDINHQAVVTCRANAELNRVRDRVLVVRGSTEAIARRFDLVLANLPLPILVDKMAELVRLGGDEASLVLSGFQDVDKHVVNEEMGRLGFMAHCWLSEDLTLPELPPSASFTWMAVLARRTNQQTNSPSAVPLIPPVC
jgi:ribosomal protein L11 methyltransferase